MVNVLEKPVTEERSVARCLTEAGKVPLHWAEAVGRRNVDEVMSL